MAIFTLFEHPLILLSRMCVKIKVAVIPSKADNCSLNPCSAA